MQLSLFGGTTLFKIDKPIRLIELFGGISCQAQALINLGVDFEEYRYCDFDKYACQSHNEIMGTNDKPSDITKWKGEDLGICDTDKFCYIMTYSFPCGLAGTKIITKNGYKNIEDITIKDYVLTHNNRFCKVKKTMSRISDHYYCLKGLGVPKLYLTENHPLYVYRDDKFQWIKVKDLSLSDKFSFNINQNSIDVELSKEYLWLLGRYVADGHINKYSYNSVNFSINFNKEQEFLKNIPPTFIERFRKFKKEVWDYRIADKQLKEICLQFKTGAKNKEIPQWIIDLPKDKLQSFFNGYISGDGHIRKRNNSKEIMFSTVSEKLFLGLQQIIAKLYHRICSCYIRKDNRKETFNDSYDCQFVLTNDESKQSVIDDKIITNIRKIEKIETDVPVYNLEIDKDNSYTCQNVITHNCTDLSTAGKMAGMERGSGTRSGLLWEVERLLKECNELPQVLLMENVPQVHGKKNKASFDEWCQFLESLGYKNYWKDLNAKDYGVPQSRNRCFMVSLLGDYSYEFPKPIELKLKLQDLLEDEVDEKYFLSDKALQGCVNTKFESSKLDNRLLQKDGCCRTLCARDYKDPKLVQVAQLQGKGFTEMTGRVYDSNGLSPTIQTMQGGNRQPKIQVVGGVGEKRSNNGTQYFMQDRIYEGDISNAICTCANPYYRLDESFVGKKYKEFVDGNGYIPDAFNPYNKAEIRDIVPTQTTQCGSTISSSAVLLKKEMCNKLIQEGKVKENDVIRHSYSTSRMNGEMKDIQQNNMCPTLDTRCDCLGVCKNYRIRKLTPTECLRLMGVRDEYIKKMTFKKEIVYLEGGTKCNAKLRIVKEKQRHLDTETYVLCTTNDILDMEMSTQTKWKKSIKEGKLENLQNVNFVIEVLEEAGHLECVTNIIKCGENTEMLYSLMKELDLHHTAIIELVQKGNKNTGKFMKILLGENFPKTKLFIISTLIEQIIKSKIYTCIVQSANIQGNIAIIENCVKNLKIMKLLNLKMEYITTLNSNAMLYKQAGNGIVVDVLMAIFKQML